MQEKTHFYVRYLEICRFFRIFAAQTNVFQIMTQDQETNTSLRVDESCPGTR